MDGMFLTWLKECLDVFKHYHKIHTILMLIAGHNSHKIIKLSVLLEITMRVGCEIHTQHKNALFYRISIKSL